MSLIKKKSGQALIEYLILTSLVAIVAIGVVRIVGQNITAHFASISNALNGDSSARSLKRVKSSATTVKNLDNFMENVNAGN